MSEKKRWKGDEMRRRGRGRNERERKERGEKSRTVKNKRERDDGRETKVEDRQSER